MNTNQIIGILFTFGGLLSAYVEISKLKGVR